MYDIFALVLCQRISKGRNHRHPPPPPPNKKIIERKDDMELGQNGTDPRLPLDKRASDTQVWSAIVSLSSFLMLFFLGGGDLWFFLSYLTNYIKRLLVNKFLPLAAMLT